MLLAFYDYPRALGPPTDLRTTNPIDSTFATVRLRQRIIKGPGFRAAGAAIGVQTHRTRADSGRAVNARTSSHSCAAARPSSTENSSNDPPDQKAKLKPRETPIHRY
jgi:hypothetical protein